MVGIGKYFKWIVLLAMLLVMYFFINSVDYFDISNLCYIKINEEPLNGNRKTIIAALKKIKADDKVAYENVCNYVDRIKEGYCERYFLMSAKKDPNFKPPGCYVLGSKIIYLRPMESNSEVEKRVESIKKYSSSSREFWQNK